MTQTNLNLPSFAVKDEKQWELLLAEAANDEFLADIAAHAAKWAAQMEYMIAQGHTVAESAAPAADRVFSADRDPFLYAGAGLTLKRVWEHGEALEAWHLAEFAKIMLKNLGKSLDIE